MIAGPMYFAKRRKLTRSTARRLAVPAVAMAAVALFGVGLSSAGDGSFTTVAPGSPFAAPGSPEHMVVGDFDNDGREDLAVSEVNAKKVTVLRGTGGGSFAPFAGSPFGAGEGPDGISVADFNGDDNEDLAIGDDYTSQVTVLEGSGGGAFTPFSGSPIAVGSGLTSIGTAVGDFDNDGNEDLAVTDAHNDKVSILLGSGDGKFHAATGSPITVADGPFELVVGDFDGDGHEDLAVASFISEDITVLRGYGPGQFIEFPGSPVALGSEPSGMALGDFNGDGNEDLAVANYESDDVQILRGSGNGRFTPFAGSPVVVKDEPVAIAAGQFDNDGNQDLALASRGSKDITILRGSGSGGFAPFAGPPAATGDAPSAISVGDFDGNGSEDLATANFNSNDVTVRLGGGPPLDSGNLLANGGGEAPPGQSAARDSLASPGVPGWSSSGPLTDVRYGAAGGFPARLPAAAMGGQEAFFAGGPTATGSSATQTVDVSAAAASIDAGAATVRLSGYLGGFFDAEDAMTVKATFESASGAPLGAPLQIGPVTASERQDRTTLLPRLAAAAVPAGTRSIRVTLVATHADGAYTDAYADRIGLFLDAPAAPDRTPPQTTITGRPAGKIHTNRARYSFKSSEAGSSFQCALDKGKFRPCSSPAAYRHLGFGKHRFAVRATDAAGNADPTPASDSFKRTHRRKHHSKKSR